MEKWENDRDKRGGKGRNSMIIEWEAGETMEWLGELFKVAGLGRLTGEGRTPPRLGRGVRWAVEHLRKYPEAGRGEGKVARRGVLSGRRRRRRGRRGMGMRRGGC